MPEPPPPGLPPVPVPGADPGTGWKWNRDDNNSRGGTWGPTKPVKGRSQPAASWDSEGHWDVKDGLGGTQRYDKNGNPLTPEEAHRDRNAPCDLQGATNETTVTVANGIVLVGGGYIAYRIVRFVPSLVPALWWTAPTNAMVP